MRVPEFESDSPLAAPAPPYLFLLFAGSNRCSYTVPSHDVLLPALDLKCAIFLRIGAYVDRRGIPRVHTRAWLQTGGSSTPSLHYLLLATLCLPHHGLQKFQIFPYIAMPCIPLLQSAFAVRLPSGVARGFPMHVFPASHPCAIAPPLLGLPSILTFFYGQHRYIAITATLSYHD